MSVDRTKVLEAAQRHLAKGNYDKAIAELRKIVEAEPTDIRTWLKIGDLYTRKGARREAIETYSRVASQYGDQGFFLKAVAVYKQILKLDPSRLDIQLKLAEMYEMLQLVSDALATYEHVAAGYARTGQIEQVLATLARMTSLDPENIPVRIKSAEALSKAGRAKEAAAEFEAGAALLKQQGRFDDYIKVAERLLYHRPEDVSVARELADLYLQRDDPKRALAKLQLCFKADPKDIKTLELLAEAFRQLGQLPKTISVYKEVGRIHQEAGRSGERARILKRILELDPGDAESRQALASLAAPSASARRDIGPPASAVVEPSRRAPPPSVEEDLEPELSAGELDEGLDDELDEIEEIDVEDDDDLIIVEEEVVQAEAPEQARPEPRSASRSVPPDVQREAQIARLLTECDVFLRYGLKAKVIDQLHAVLEIDPLHVEARERLKELHLADGRVEEAVTELLTLADILSHNESSVATLYLRHVLSLDPSNEEALSRLAQASPSAAQALAPEPPAEDEVFFVEEETGEIDALEVEALEVEPVTGPALSDERDIEPVSMSDGDVVDVSPPTTPPDPVPTDPVQTDEHRLPTPRPDEAPLPELSPAELAPEPASSRVVVPSPSGELRLPPSRRAIVPPPSGAVRVPPPSGLSPLEGAAAQAGLRDPLAPMTPEEFDEVPLRPSTPGEMSAETSQRLSSPPGEVEEILDEADFFIAQGLFDEARGTLGDALDNYPEHPLLLDKLREVNALAARASVAPSRPPADGMGDHSFELAERLAEEFDEVDETQTGSDVLDVEQVFAQFKKGVEEQVGIEDTETHFDLGIAYKEMGLLDDAIAEFRLCVANPQRLCIAETMIGLCHIEKGSVAEAITHFKKGLYADTKSDREELGLYYELGRAYEMLHDPKEALYYYQKVQKRDPGFRGVEARILGLTQPAAAAEAAPSMGQDDIDRAFDDLMGED